MEWSCKLWQDVCCFGAGKNKDEHANTKIRYIHSSKTCRITSRCKRLKDLTFYKFSTRLIYVAAAFIFTPLFLTPVQSVFVMRSLKQLTGSLISYSYMPEAFIQIRHVFRTPSDSVSENHLASSSDRVSISQLHGFSISSCFHQLQSTGPLNSLGYTGDQFAAGSLIMWHGKHHTSSHGLQQFQQCRNMAELSRVKVPKSAGINDNIMPNTTTLK